MPTNTPLNSPVAIASSHDTSIFDCGDAALNDYLRRYALANQRSESARTYVATRESKVVAYYTLAAGSVRPEQATDRIRKGLAKHAIPVVLLARLAVDRSEQGQGLGKGILKDAMFRATQAADIIGCRAILVHAKDEAAKLFYQRFDFALSPTDDLHLMLLMKDLRKNLGL